MPADIFPAEAEIPALIPSPDSILWQRMGDARGLLAAGYALVLQVSHPTVGAGVAEHSDFRADPWGRLMRTLDFVNLLVYGGPQKAAETGRRVREFHKQIKGVRPDGERYHALEPEAYAWVHATLAEAAVKSHTTFARPMTWEQKGRFWQEWRDLGRLLGIRERDLPETWAEFLYYRDEMIIGTLQRTEALDTFFEAMAAPAGPPIPVIGGALWPIARLPATRVLHLATAGLMGPTLRERFEIPWSRAEALELRALGLASRSTTPILPDQLRVMGPHHLRWRERQIARGDVAGPKSAENARRHAAARAA